MSKSWFINNIDSYVCNNLLEEITKDKENPPDFPVRVTYSDPNIVKKPFGVKKVLKLSKPKLFAKYLRETDILVYDLHELEIQELNRIIDILKNTKEFENQKKIILISSLLSWFHTEKIQVPKNYESNNNMNTENNEEDNEEEEEKEKKEEEDKNIDKNNTEEKNIENNKDAEDENNKEEENNEEEDENKIKEESIKDKTIEYETFNFKEANHDSRIPHKCFEKQKLIEDEFFKLVNLNENLEIIIIYSGLLYGKGEMLLFDNIEQAWLQKSLKIYNDGNNKIPMFNIENLSKLIIRLTDLEKDNENYPKNNCIFAYETPLLRQEKIIKKISSSIGNNETFIEKEDVLVSDINYSKNMIANEFLKIKINFDSDYTRFVNNIEEEEIEEKEENNEENDEEENIKKVKKIDLSKTILFKLNDILKNFCYKMNLKPIKIVLFGRDIKKISTILSEHYKTPIIDIYDLFKELEKNNEYFLSKMKKNLRLFWDKFGKNLIERINKKERTEILDDLEILFLRIIKWRLNLNDCMNKGYVLVGFDLPYKYYKLIFEKNKELRIKKDLIIEKIKESKIVTESNQDNLNNDSHKRLNTNESKNSIIGNSKNNLSKSELKNKLNKFEESKVEEDEDELSIISNLSKYSLSNENSLFLDEKIANPEDEDEVAAEVEEDDDELPKFILESYIPETAIYFKDELNIYDNNFIKYLIENQIEYLYYDLANKKDLDILYSLKIFIERNIRPFNYLENEVSIWNKYEKYLNNLEKEKQNNKEKIKQKNFKIKNDKRIKREKNAVTQIDIIKKKILALNEKSNKANEDIRDEFFNNYESIISEGLFEIIKIKPEDPIEFLSEFIYNKSYQI